MSFKKNLIESINEDNVEFDSGRHTHKMAGDLEDFSDEIENIGSQLERWIKSAPFKKVYIKGAEKRQINILKRALKELNVANKSILSVYNDLM